MSELPGNAEMVYLKACCENCDVVPVLCGRGFDGSELTPALSLPFNGALAVDRTRVCDGALGQATVLDPDNPAGMAMPYPFEATALHILSSTRNEPCTPTPRPQTSDQKK